MMSIEQQQRERAERAEADVTAMLRRALRAEAKAAGLEEALRECLIQAPRENPPIADCLCRWCKARRLLAPATPSRVTEGER